MSPRPDDDEAPRRKPGRSGPEPDPAKFPFGESLNPNAAGADRARFPFGDTLDESDEAALGVPGASTTGDEEEELVSAEDLDEPTLRALGLAGSKSSDYLDSDLGALVDSDLGALDTSGDVIRDTGEYDPEDEIFDSSSSLPNVPPGSTPDDDASLAGIASGTGALDDDDDDPMFTPSELGRVSDMGAIGPSGPLVIVDDEAQSTRFSASVAGDDSVRLAGARSARRPGQRGARRPPKEPAPPPSEDFEASWDDGDLDVDVPVPTVSARKPPARDTPRGKEPRKGTGKEPRKGTGKEPRKATGKGKRETRATGAQSRVASGRARRPGRDSARSGEAAPAAAEVAAPRRRKAVVLLLLLLLSSCGVSVGLELKRRADVAHLRGELAALRATHAEELTQTRGGLEQALNLARGEKGELSERLRGVEDKLSEARQALDGAHAEQRAQRAAFQGELDAKLEAERERLLRERAAALEVELAKAVEEALSAERDEVQAQIDAAVEEAKAADGAELERLRARNADLEAALEAEREARERAEEALRRAREGTSQGGDGSDEDASDGDFGDDPFADGDDGGFGDDPFAGGGDGGSELDDFFGDGPASRKRPSGGGSELDDFFGGGSSGGGGELDDFFGGGGEQAAADTPQEDPDAPNALEEGWATFTDYVHGNLSYRLFAHFQANGSRQTRNEVSLTLEFDHWYWLKENRTAGLHVVANVETRADDDHLYGGTLKGIDDEEPKRPYIVPNQLYAGFLYERFELRVGYQRFAWGTGDMFNPTDQLNPSDYSDLFASRRIPVFSAMVNLTLQFEFGNVDVELISIPTFTRTRVPPSGTRFDPLQGFPLTVLRPDDPPGSLQDAQWAARVTLRAKGWDVSLSAFTGFDDLPAGQLATVVIFPPVLQVEPIFDRIHMLGSDFATTLGFLGITGPTGDLLSRIQIHGEAAHTFYEGPRADEVLQYVVGLNYTFVDLVAEHDLTVILEYAGELITKRSEVTTGSNLGRVLSGAVLLRLQYEVSPQPRFLLKDLNFALNLAANLDGDENAWVHPEVNYTVTDYFSMQLAADVFFGPKDTFFGQYERDGRLILNAKLSF